MINDALLLIFILLLLLSFFWVLFKLIRNHNAGNNKSVQWKLALTAIYGLVIASASFYSNHDIDRSYRIMLIPRQLELTREKLGVIRHDLQVYRDETGGFPTNDQGLRALLPAYLKEFHGVLADLSNKPIGRLSINELGILSRWGEPFIYENRTGLKESKFKDSGATVDKARVYSIQVDKGIYVWSIGAQRAYKTYRVLKPLLSITYVGAFIASLLSLFVIPILLFKRAASKQKSILLGIVVFLSGLCILVLGQTNVRSCYEAGGINWPPDRKLTEEYLALIKKYRDRGIIGDKACEKIVDSMESVQEN